VTSLFAVILLGVPALQAALPSGLPSLPTRALLQGAEPPPAPVPAPAAPPSAVIVAAAGAAVLAEDELLRRLSGADAVYVGETHDAPLHHEVQLAVLRGLSSTRPGLRLGLEMLSLDQQPVLDDYLSGRMSEADFAAFWSRAWGFDFALYRPLLEFARSRGMRVLGLNAPRALVSKVARGGLASLSPEERAALPASVGQSADPRYLAYVRRSLAEHGPLDPAREARMLEAMAVWNETMGASVAAAAGPDSPLLVLAGSGHLLYGAGVPESSGRRAALSRAVLLPYPLDAEPRPLPELLDALRRQGSTDIELGDYFWLLPDAP